MLSTAAQVGLVLPFSGTRSVEAEQGLLVKVVHLVWVWVWRVSGAAADPHDKSGAHSRHMASQYFQDALPEDTDQEWTH